MPPVERFVCRFAAEPPQEALPHGDWAQTPAGRVPRRLPAHRQPRARSSARRASCAGSPTARWNGRTYVPVTARTTTDLELFGYVSFVPGDPERGRRRADGLRGDRRLHRRDGRAQPGLADRRLRGGRRRLARRGRPQRGHDARVGRAAARARASWPPPSSPASPSTSARSLDDRFTLIAPDDYRGDFLDVKLWDADGRELASESLYVDDDDEDEEG